MQLKTKLALDLEKTKLLKQLEQVFDSKIEKIYDGPLDAFAYYFSRLDINGLDSLLSDYNNYDGVSKNHYINLIKQVFSDLKSKGIKSLDAVPGVCKGCINGCTGFTFIDNKTGVYVDIIIEVKNNEITNLMECHDLINEKQLTCKRKRTVIKQFKSKNKWLHTTDSFGKMEKGVVK